MKFIVSFLAVVVLLCSCQTAPVVWDASYPAEKLATVLFINMKISSYNEIGVTKFNWVKIPAGEVKLGGEVIISHAGFSFKASDMEWTCKLEEGKSYVMRGSSQDLLWGVSVYETESYQKISQENKVAFIPFKNQPKFN